MITEEPSATATDSRWTPSRAGILNVWRYYDEVFTFHRGRLLLRGRNGTGKSKALELLLPFLLDASLRANRLSTFGGNERAMHWNLIGHGYPQATRVGYVWLEFRRVVAGTEQWFTCGARLQATRDSRQVKAAYFTTSLRVGDGVSLLSPSEAPLTKDALRKALDGKGTVHAGSEDYRARVRGTLFASLNEARYDSLITALLQLRTPKLSERLDPAVLSNLLSSALPPLGRGELADIADGFERLDRQRDELKELARQVDAVKLLADRQRTYARRVLRAGAARLISATTDMDRSTRETAAANDAHATATRELEVLTARRAELGTATAECQGEIAGLRESEAYRAGADIERLREQADSARVRAEHLRKTADKWARQATERRRIAADAHEDAERSELASSAAFATAHSAADLVGMANHLLRAKEHAADGEDVTRARRSLRAAVESRSAQIREVRAAAAVYRGHAERRRGLEEDLSEAGEALDGLTAIRDGALAARDSVRQELEEALEAWAHSCVELAPLDAEAVRASVDSDGVDAVVTAARIARSEVLAAARADRERDLATLGKEREELTARLADLRTQTEVNPPVPYTRGPHRASLPGAPLWRLVRFADGVDGAVQAGVEAALEASGLLDAWLLPDGTVGVAGDVHDVFAAAAAPVRGRCLLDILAIEEDIGALAQVTAALMASVAVVDASGVTEPDAEHRGGMVVAVDGGWRLGPLRGRWSKAEPSYIGAAARERARLRAIDGLAARIRDVDARSTELKAALAAVGERRAALDEEVRRCPPTAPLTAARQAVEQAEHGLVAKRAEVSRLRARLGDVEKIVSKTLESFTSLAARHRLPTEESALAQLVAALDALRASADTWLDGVAEARNQRHQAGIAGEAADDSEEEAVESAEAAAAAEGEAAELRERFDAVRSTLGAEHAEVLERIRAAEARLRSHHGESARLAGSEQRLHKQLGVLEEKVAHLRQKREATVAVRDVEAARLRSLMEGSLYEDAGVPVERPADAAVRATLEAARAIATTLDGTAYTADQIAASMGRVNDAMYGARGKLTGVELELQAQDDVHVLIAGVNGLRLGAARLHETLREEQAQRATDLTSEERTLFDRTLTGDTRRHLADRIRQAEALVTGMNARLEKVRTASRIAVRLRWRIAPDAPEGTLLVRDLLLRNPRTLDDDDREALHQFFRDRIDDVRAAEDSTGWEENLTEVLDYTKWHRFSVQLDKADGHGWQELTRRAHGQLSGGEKAIALHLPLFAAVAAHYENDADAPRFILLDEVFVGVDTTNRGQVFALLGDLGLDLVLTSDHEWCTYTELDGIAIHQLIPGDGDDDAVTSARWVWNGAALTATGDDPEEPAA